MRKVVMVFVSVLLVIGLTGCFNYNTLEKNFEEIGYEVSINASNITAIYASEFTEEGINVDSFVFSDGEGSVALIFDFDDENDIDQAFMNSSLLIGLIDEGYTKEELSRDHYIVVPISSSPKEIDTIINAFHD